MHTRSSIYPRLLLFFIFAFCAPAAAFADEPTIQGTHDVTVQATSSLGAYVSYSVTGADTDSSPLVPACAPASGSLFTLGTTTVSCTAVSVINPASTTKATFGVSIIDTTPPDIVPPPDQVFSTTTIPAQLALVPATAKDLVDPSPAITYAPHSFPLGTTTVTWTATDASGNDSATTSNVNIRFSLDAAVDVPATCDATDLGGVVHTYTASSSASYLGICALVAAIAHGDVANAQLSNQYPDLGLFVASIDGITANPSSQYWALYHNGSFASFGLTQLPVSAGDTVTLQLHDFSDNDLGAALTLSIRSLISTSTAPASPPSDGNGNGNGGGGISHSSLNIASALVFLSSHQNTDGSFGSGNSSMISDWSALAFAASDPGTAKVRLRAYLASSTPAMGSITDYERHAMALEALGINPYAGTSVDYITPIAAAFDGTQIGDTALDNDDIFAIIPLMQAGYSPADPMISKVVSHIFASQKPDGSWDESADMTAAAIQAVGPFFMYPTYPQQLGAAAGYLLSKEQSNGSWGAGGVTNIDSTSWVQTAINGIPTDPAHGGISWASRSGYLPTDAIAAAQQSDGAVRPTSDSEDNRVWSTSYAVVAASGQSWLTVLQSFSKPASAVGGGGSVTIANSSTSSAATTTEPSATSTTSLATSTVPVATSTPVSVVILKPVPTLFNIQPNTGTSTLRHPLRKRITPASHAALVASAATTSQASQGQTAAAANAPAAGFFGSIWHAITSFFGAIF